MIERRYVTLGERQVHLRCAGSGPTALLLHQSPMSSRELEPLIDLLSPHFRVLAPDTPGYGLSDPLAPPDSEPDIDRFVDALVRLLDALQAGPVYLFGTHTGAILATRLAARYPQRVHCLVANGVLVNSRAERADLVRDYFPAFRPHWDGSHLAWLWSRLRDQFSFFPWYAREPEQRYAGTGEVAQMEVSAMEFLQAGDNYRAAYRAVIDYAIADDMARLTVPTCMLVAAPDPLSESVPNYPLLPPQVTVNVVPAFADIAPAALEYFLAREAPAPAAPAFPAPALAVGTYRDFQPLQSGVVHLRRSAPGRGERPLLCLHAPGASSRAFAELLQSLSGSRTVIAPDLPGHGDSTLVADDGDDSVQETAQCLLALLDALGEGEVDVLALGESWTYATALSELAPQRVRGLLCVNPVFAGEHLHALLARPVPDLQGDEAGSHLQRAWFYLRDRQLFHPWFSRAPENVMHGLLRPSAQRMHGELIDLLKSRSGLDARLRDAWSFSPQRLPPKAILFACDWHPVHGQREDVARLPDEFYRWAPLLMAALEQ